MGILKTFEPVKMPNAKFASLIKTVKNSRYMDWANSKDPFTGEQFKRFIRYTTDPPKDCRSEWGRTHNIDIFDNNKVCIESHSSSKSYVLTDSQMKELVDTLNKVPSVASLLKSRYGR